MTLDAALQQAILDNPADGSARLIYADWLEEQGDPRAELFRLQYALTQAGDGADRRALEARQQQLLESGVPPAAITVTNSIGMKFSLIPPGEYWMGSSDADIDEILRSAPDTQRAWFASEQPRHRVRLTRPFFLGVFAVTQEEFSQVMGRNPSHFQPGGDGKTSLKGIRDTRRFPVENVSWHNAVEFCNRLSQRKGRPPYYELTDVTQIDGAIQNAVVSLAGGHGYRLPTEAEWEYACRAGTTTLFHFGSAWNGRQANVCGRRPFGASAQGPFLQRPTDVGSYLANPWGLYDMHGNVWEWRQDAWRHDFYRDAPSEDPVCHDFDFDCTRVLRGGSWVGIPRICRAADRNWSGPAFRSGYAGFRVARTP